MGLVINADLKEEAESCRRASVSAFDGVSNDTSKIYALQSIAQSNLVIIDLLERILSTLCEKDT